MEQSLASDDDGCAFVRALRASRREPVCWAPVILTMGHVRATDVARARDCGANVIVTKPITSDVLLQRILWVGRERREFIDTAAYLGPDRRFRFLGPPRGSLGRRATDRNDPLGEATEDNLSQDELNGMFRAQRMTLEL